MEQTKEIVFFYADQRAVKAANRAVVYNFRDNVWYGPFDVVGSEVDSTCAFSIDFANVIDSFNTVYPDNINTIIDLYGVTKGVSGEPLFGTSNGDVMSLGNENTANGTFFTRSATTGAVFLGAGGATGDGGGMNFPFGSVFQVNQVNIELMETTSATASYYLGYKMTLTDSFTWKGPYILDGLKQRKLNIPVRSGPARWVASKFEMVNNATLQLAGFEYFFSFIGER
jgi:hypothetical protein